MSTRFVWTCVKGLEMFTTLFHAREMKEKNEPMVGLVFERKGPGKPPSPTHSVVGICRAAMMVKVLSFFFFCPVVLSITLRHTWLTNGF